MNPLDRKPLPVRLADEVESSIRSGEWTGHLPGHRALMKAYGVSAATCLDAIGHLEARGVIAPAEIGKKRSILLTAGHSGKTLENLLIVRNATAISGGAQSMIQAFRSAWEETGGHVSQQQFDLPRYRHPAKLLREAVEKHRADALLLHIGTGPWTSAAAVLRPTFLDGGEPSASAVTGSGYHLTNEIRRLVSELQNLGHRRIVVPLDHLGSRLEQGVRIAMAECLALPISSPRVTELCPVFPERTPEAWRRYWQKLFATVKPTAVLLNKDIHVHSLYGFCSRQGIAIPDDLSVICLESTDALAWCEPVPTCMRYPAEEAISYFKKWIRSGCSPLGWKSLPLEHVEGTTVARVP